MTATTHTEELERAKKIIMQRINEEDNNVTFDELEYLLHKNKMYEETYNDNKQIITWVIWANDENLILWTTTNKLLAQAWSELKDEDKFDTHYTSFHTYGAYSSPTGGFPADAQIANKEVARKAGTPGYPPLKKRYFQPIEMRRKLKNESKESEVYLIRNGI